MAEHSMLPALAPGDEFVASSSLAPRPGSVVAFEHPRRRDFWLVKRVSRREGLAEDRIWVESDNRSVDSVDSRQLGPIPLEAVLTLVERLDPKVFEEAVALLASEDASVAAVVEEHGVPVFWERSEGFATLALLIIEQQVSLESGAAVFTRLTRLCGEVTPEAVLSAGEVGMRAVGITRQKASYLVELADRVGSGDLDLGRLGDMRAAESREALVAIRGIGAWTADAYLLSALRLPDIFPVGDRALQVGTMEMTGLGSPPSGDDLLLVAEPWRPLRAVAARLIWHAYLTRRGRSEPVISGLGPGEGPQPPAASRRPA